MSKKTFHHGDLRNSLIELALTELERVGYEQLSLRELAKTLGVSRAAPYRHFESKEVLLRALAGIGLRQLGDAYQAVAEIEQDPASRLSAACRSYLEFANQKPELYRLIFTGDLDWREVVGGEQNEVATDSTSQTPTPESFTFFEQLVSDALENDDAETVRKAALIAWSMIHGCAKLRMDGMLSAFIDPEEFETVLVNVASKVKAFDI
jgi:AcrR family transcriptional regulator